MSQGAASQLRRILHVIPRLADGEEHPIADVARLAEVEVNVLLADLESVSERYDVPGGFVEDVQIFVNPRTVTVLTNHLRRPMRLTMAELCALELGLALLRRERSPDDIAPIDGALTRLRQVITQLPANERHEGLRHAELGVHGGAAHLAVVREALRSRFKVRLGYRSGGSSTVSDRVICPCSLVHANGTWYVVAFSDGESGVLRFFRIDRVVSAVRLGEGFEQPDTALVDSVLGDDKPFHAEDAASMTVRYSPRVARWVAEREGKPLAPDGSLTMDHPVADMSWAVRHVLQYGPDAEVLEPAEVRAAVRQGLERMADALGVAVE